MMTTTQGSSTTYFVNNYYEVTNGVVTKYYYAGTQRIAMRKNGTLTFMVSTSSTQRLADHLCSTSLTTDSAGNVISELRYTAWGEVRYQAGTTSTGYQFTGQYSYAADFGLLYYGARFYDPQLGRFSSPDSIIPQSQGVQGWDRYAYVNNNPVSHNDPTGHCSDFISCITPDAFVLSIGYNASFPVNVENVVRVFHLIDHIDSELPISLPLIAISTSYKNKSLDLVIVPFGENPGSAYYDTVSKPALIGEDSVSGVESPQLNVTVTGSILWDTTDDANSFNKQGVNAYAGDSRAGSTALARNGYVSASNYFGITGGESLGVPNAYTYIEQNSVKSTFNLWGKDNPSPSSPSHGSGIWGCDGSIFANC